MADGFNIVIKADDITADMYDVPILINLGISSGISAFDTTAVFDNLTDPTKLKFIYKPYLPELLTHNETAAGMPDVKYAWAFDETSGNNAYDSIGSNTVTFAITPQWNEPSLATNTNEGTCAYFNGNDGSMSRVTPASGDFSVVFTIHDTSYGNQALALMGEHSNSVLLGFVNITGELKYGSVEMAAPANGTRHITFVKEGSAVHYYEDGYTRHNGNQVVNINYAFDYMMTSSKSTAQNMVVFHRALTSTEAEELYDVSFPIVPVDTTVPQQWCNAEIDRWDQGNEQGQIWVKIPYISKDVDTVIQIQYNSAQSVNTEYVDLPGTTAAKDVWAQYEAVYHLSNDGTDSGNNSNDGTLINAPTIIDFGKGKGLSFNGTTQSISLTEANFTDIYTVSLIIELTDVIGIKTLFDGINGGWYVNVDKISFNKTSDGTTALTATTTYDIAIDSTGNVYIDGIIADNVTPDAVALLLTAIATEETTPANWFSGKMKELRFSLDIKSATWHSTNKESILDNIVTYTQSTLLSDIIETSFPSESIGISGSALNSEQETAEVWSILPANIGITGQTLDSFKGKIVTFAAEEIHLTMNYPIAPSWFYEILIEEFNVNDTLDINKIQIFKVLELLLTQSSTKTNCLNNMVTVEKFKVFDLVELYIRFIIVEAVKVLDTALDQIAIDKLIVELMHSIDISSSQIIAKQYIIDSIRIIDNALGINAFIVIDRMNILSTVQITIELIFNIAETIKSLDTLSPTFIAVLSTTEAYTINDNISSQVIFKDLISENINTFGTIVIDNEHYTFVINTNTHGISEYTNYNFNSMSEGLAATSTGIYKLSGPDDNGNDINAYIKTGLLDFDSSKQKQIPYAYIGLNKSGKMLLKTIVDYKGTRKERWYSMTPRIVDATDTVRIQLGKGIKSKYWQFEISNINGEDFELDSIELLPLILNRRVQ